MAALPESLDLPIGTQIDIQILGIAETARLAAREEPTCLQHQCLNGFNNRVVAGHKRSMRSRSYVRNGSVNVRKWVVSQHQQSAYFSHQIAFPSAFFAQEYA